MRGCESFYLTPVNKPKSDVWYKSLPMGINTISKCMSRLSMSLGSDKFLTNTSQRRTAKTRLTTAGLPREVVAKKTGNIERSCHYMIKSNTSQYCLSKHCSGHLSEIDGVYVDGGDFEKTMSMCLYAPNQNDHHATTLEVFSHVSQVQPMSQLATMAQVQTGVPVSTVAQVPTMVSTVAQVSPMAPTVAQVPSMIPALAQVPNAPNDVPPTVTEINKNGCSVRISL